MQILIISRQPIQTLFGKTLPWEGTNCVIEKELININTQLFDCIIVLEASPDQIQQYQTIEQPLLLGAVSHLLTEFDGIKAPVARFNNWPVLIDRPCIEYSTNHPVIFTALFENWRIPFYATADQLGLVAARTISMIVNEAFLALEEKVATAADINTAMKLGTSYPMGPFEWAQAIGTDKIVALLNAMSTKQEQYQPALSLLNFKAN